mmetsp:Transcript_97779/g.304026  ORF Transcript_97779/g.304026 Transcript_97779/m.304026 type:complete len:493 (+) Transcript_97779:3-1481(+)
MHRDIKPANIFLAEHGVVKLGDLGLGRYFSSNTYRAHSVVGTPFYMSPEVIVGSGGYSFKSDIWSLGCVLYELTTLECPFAGSGLNYYALGNRISRAEYAPLPEGTPARICSLCDEMLRVQQDARPDATSAWLSSGRYLDASGAQYWARKRAEEEVELELEGDQQPEPARRLMRAAAVVRGVLEKGPSPRRPPRPRAKAGASAPDAAASVAASLAAAAVSAVVAAAAPSGGKLAQSCVQPPSGPAPARPRAGCLSHDARRGSRHRAAGRAQLPALREASPRPQAEETDTPSSRSSNNGVPCTAREHRVPGATSPPTAPASAREHRGRSAASPPAAPATAREHRGPGATSPPTVPLTAREPRSGVGPRRAASPRTLAPLRAASPRAPSPRASSPSSAPAAPLSQARASSPPCVPPGRRPQEEPPARARPEAAVGPTPAPPIKPLGPRRTNSPRTGRLASLAEQALLAPREGSGARGATPPPVRGRVPRPDVWV